MSRAWVIPARAFSVLVSMIMLMFTLGVALPASADPPEDRSNQSSAANGNSAAAHEKNTDRKSESTSSTTMAATTGGDATASSKGSSETNATKSHRGNGKAKASSHAISGTSGTSGDVKAPQKESTADQNSGGANAGTCHDSTATPGGPYCSTRDGTESGNGQGVGKATGKPCAGCVGKADNKNPPGQLPGPQDRNNGYECDNNNGIGKGKANSKDGADSAGNPAHTGCVTPTTSDDCIPQPGQDENCNEVDEDCVPKPGQDRNCDEVDEDCVPKPGQDKNCNEVDEDCPDGSDLPCEQPECPDGTDRPCGPPECPEGQTGAPPNCGEVLGEEEFSPPPTENRPPPTIKGVQQFAQPPAVAPQAGVLPSTGAASMTSGLLTAGFALLLMGGAVIGLRRQSLARAKR